MKDFLQALMHRLRLLPLLVVVATLAFAVRIGDAVVQVRDWSGAVQAADAETPSQDGLKKPEVKDPAAIPDPATVKTEDDKAASDEKSADEKPGDVELPATPDSTAKSPAWSDASDGDIDYSSLRKELYEDLLQRRQQLDAKEKALGQREALLEAGEKEIGKKYEELSGLRNEIQELLKKQSEEESARISSLVKIYEGMKAKDAARIFNTLDMDILLDVVSKMSERKTAPVIAEMDAEKARELTTLLAEQKKLPELPPDAVLPKP